MVARVSNLEHLFPGKTEMARRMRALDWSKTVLGPPLQWAEPLKHSVKLCLTSRFPIVMYWGAERIMLYNDPYIRFLGETKHPTYLGRTGREAWSDIWDTIDPLFQIVQRTGEASWSEDFLFFFARNLPKEEIYVTYTIGPILLDSGQVEGFFCPCAEVTEKVIGARRLETLRKLGIQALETRTVDEACAAAANVLAENPFDIPFAAIYLVTDQGTRAVLKSLSGLSKKTNPLPSAVSVSDADPSPWPLATVLRERRLSETPDLVAADMQVPGGPWPEPSSKAIVLPVFGAQHETLSALAVLGVGPRRVLDDAYRTFFDLIAGHIRRALTDARAYEAEHAHLAAEFIERQRASEALRTSENRFRRYFDLGLIGMAITSPTKGILEVNDELCRILGYDQDELLQKSWAELTHPDDLAADLAQFNRVIAGEIDAYALDKRWIRKDGHIVTTIMSAKCVRRKDGSVDYFVGLIQDITRRKLVDTRLRDYEKALHKAEAELAHVSRVTTLGELTASIAHEVNQPLGAIVTNGHACLRLLSRAKPDLASAREAIESMIADGVRASEVIKRIRAMLKKTSTGKSSYRLNEIIREVIAFTAAEREKHQISLKTHLANDLPLVLVDRVQLQQVVLNLVLNGIEAMSAPDLEPRELLIQTEQTAAKEVLITIRDTGYGIDPQHRDHVFEPFFTSKEGGVGLGLSISRTIIDAHGGKLWTVSSTHRQGTTFSFTLPVERIHESA